MSTARHSLLLLAFCARASQASPIIIFSGGNISNHRDNQGAQRELPRTAGQILARPCIAGVVPNGVCQLLSAVISSALSPTSPQMPASSSSTTARTLPSNGGSSSSTNEFLSSTGTDLSSGQSTSMPGAGLSPAQKPVSTGAAVAIGVAVAFFVCGLVLALIIRRRRRRQDVGQALTMASPFTLARTSTGHDPVQTKASMVNMQNGNVRMLSRRRADSEAWGLFVIPRRGELPPGASARRPSAGNILTSPAGEVRTSEVEAEIRVSRNQLNMVLSRISALEANRESAGGPPPEYV
ncbi:hypothetical protein K438DRAFT_1942145 [Mycena galopus ATCC 62051]|nr:hypothetical protein K438DRAFT_1942145 [Mycena galopus ATCC 62051]